MAKQICRQYNLVISGDDESAFNEALEEAIRLLKEGNLSGSNQNETSGFYFNSNEHVHPAFKPA